MNRSFPQTAAAATVASAAETASPWAKRPGETKVVAMMGGDCEHNRTFPEMHIRGLFAPKKDWRILFVQSSEFFSPELISDADLLIVSRNGRPDDIRWRPGGIADTLEKGSPFWTDGNAGAIIGNVRRGMGFLALHDTIACGNRDIETFLGMTPIPHNEPQPLWIHDINRDHPVSGGTGRFLVSLDEQFAAILEDAKAQTLFLTTGMHDKRRAAGGWTIERSNGRIVVMLPGHTVYAYQTVEYQRLLWRAAHWAMHRDIPPFPAG